MRPFQSVFLVHNVRRPITDLPIIYVISGLSAVIVGPSVGEISDRFGKLRAFLLGTALMCVMVVIWINRGPTPLPIVIVTNVVMFMGVFSRLIRFQAIMSAVPEVTRRGAFNGISSSLQQFSGGLASVIAGMIFVQTSTGEVQHFNSLGYVMVVLGVVGATLVWLVRRGVPERLAR